MDKMGPYYGLVGILVDWGVGSMSTPAEWRAKWRVARSEPLAKGVVEAVEWYHAGWHVPEPQAEGVVELHSSLPLSSDPRRSLPASRLMEVPRVHVLRQGTTPFAWGSGTCHPITQKSRRRHTPSPYRASSPMKNRGQRCLRKAVLLGFTAHFVHDLFQRLAGGAESPLVEGSPASPSSADPLPSALDKPWRPRHRHEP